MSLAYNADVDVVYLNQEERKIEQLLAAAAKRPDCYSIEQIVTPVLARAMLNKNYERNRTLRKQWIKDYAAVMKNGGWVTSGESIKFNWNNVMDDGQHRLHAVILANVPVKMSIAFNTDPKAFDVYDTGLKRNGGDTLNHAGYKNVAALAAALRTLWLIERTGGIGRDKVSNRELLVYIQAHPDLEHCVPPGKRLSTAFSISTAGATACYYRIQQESQYTNRLTEFWDSLISGANLPPKSPLLELRKKLFDKKMMYNVRIERACEVAAAIVLCWNAWITGKRGNLSWDHKTFPTAV